MRSHPLCVLFALLLPCSTAIAGDDVGQLNTAVADILRVWQQRQADVKTFEISWKGKQFESKAFAIDPNSPEEPTVASHDVTFDFAMQFIADEHGRMRRDYEGKAWSPEKNHYVRSAATKSFNGRTHRTFFPYGTIEFPSMFINTGDASNVGRYVRLLPIRLVLRPLDESVGVFDGTVPMVLSNEPEIIDGSSCMSLKIDTRHVWVDPQRDFVPVRYSSSSDGVTDKEITFKYAEPIDGVWIPSAWKFVQFTPEGDVSRAAEATVTRVRINETVPESAFQIEYPPGTWVRNHITNERYIVREGKPPRPILKGEYTGDNYEQLLNSEPATQERFSPRTALVAISLILLAVLAAFAVFRRPAGKVSGGDTSG